MIFFRKSFFLHEFGLFSTWKKAFSKKYDFWKVVRKSFLGTPDILSGYLGCSPDSGLYFPNFRMVIRRSWRILSMKNEKFSVFPKRDVVKAFVKGSKRANFQKRFFSKKFSKKSFGHIKILTAVSLYNLILLNRMALSESRSDARNTKISEKPQKVLHSGQYFLYLFIHSIF